jgi:hypothetical protein
MIAAESGSFNRIQPTGIDPTQARKPVRVRKRYCPFVGMPDEMSAQVLHGLPNPVHFSGVVCGGLRAGSRSSMPCRKITGEGSYTAQPYIYMRYAAELEAIAALDREYYLNPSPNLAQRAEYYNRQEYLEQIRRRLYSELSETQHRQ